MTHNETEIRAAADRLDRIFSELNPNFSSIEAIMLRELLTENQRFRAALEQIIEDHDRDFVNERCLAQIANQALHGGDI